MDEERSGILADTKIPQEVETTTQPTVYNPGAKTPLNTKAFWRVLISLELSMFAIAIDFYSIPVAVPWLSSPNPGYVDSAWLGTAFLASFALGLLVWPRLSEALGSKFCFIMAMCSYNVSNSFTGTSNKLWSLIAWRIAAGGGAGGAYGLFDMILRDIVPPEEFEKYMSASRAIWAVTAAGSPLVGGALIEYISHRLYFELGHLPRNIGYWMALFYLPESPMTQESIFQGCRKIRQFDYLGILCLTAGTVCVMLATASDGTLSPWVTNHAVGLAIGGLAFFSALFFIEPLVPDPLLPPSLFHNRGLLGIVVAAFFYGANLVGTMYYVPQFFQIVLQDNAIISSLSTLPMMLGGSLGIGASLLIASRYRASLNLARIGAALQALASGLLVRWGTETSRAETTVVLALLGLGQGAAMIGLLRSAQACVSHVALGIVTRLFMFVQASGHAFGVAFFAALYVNKLQTSLYSLMPNIDEQLAETSTDKVAYGAEVRQRVLDAFASSMRSGWWLMFACAGILSILTFMVERSNMHEAVEPSTVDDAERVSEAEKEHDQPKDLCSISLHL